jgi:hypothetical protein
MIFDFSFLMYVIQYCFICRTSNSTLSEDAGIEPRTLALTARRSYHSAIDLIHTLINLRPRLTWDVHFSAKLTQSSSSRDGSSQSHASGSVTSTVSSPDISTTTNDSEISTATEQVPTVATEVEAGQLVDPDRAGLAAEPSRSESQPSPSRFAIPISNQKMPLDFEMMPDLSRF